MPSRKDLEILKQVKGEDDRNKSTLGETVVGSQPHVTLDGGWTVTIESVVAEDQLITEASDINISKEHKPSRSPLL